MSAGLDRALSPYLVSCAQGPVAWRAWDGALAEAQRAGRPLLLSIGDFASDATRLSDDALFTDREILRALREDLIPVKVDRHERPDIEAVYALLVAGDASDSLAAVVLTPEGLPLRRLGNEERAPAAIAAIQETVLAFRRNPDRVRADARAARALVHRAAPAQKAPPSDSADARVRAVIAAASGAGPDPAPHGALRLLLRAHRAGQADALPAARAVLTRLARSPAHDHLAGGFHRGAVDGRPPRLEKLLCHNALLLRAYAETAAASGDLLLRNVAHETAAWTIREMRDAAGYFWSSLAANVPGAAGGYYSWTAEDVRRWLGPDRSREFLATYALEPSGLLLLEGSPFAGLGPDRLVLLNRRARRVRPPVDDEVFTGWNGLMLGALAREGKLLERGSDVEAARQAAEALLSRVGPIDTLKRSVRGQATGERALLEDYAFLAEGLLDLGDATGEPRWREHVRALVDAAVLRFWDPVAGGFFETDGGDRQLPLRPKRDTDAEVPAANAVMASVLARLGGPTGDARYWKLSRGTLSAFAGTGFEGGTRDALASAWIETASGRP